ncbi:hypothetical protein BC833DRAFT_567360 [Globomyces pollinis-pini]|nr:hypothetical protein BC833DRAFT_567360 [Globomyces pollinis-pini]
MKARFLQSVQMLMGICASQSSTLNSPASIGTSNLPTSSPSSTVAIVSPTVTSVITLPASSAAPIATTVTSVVYSFSDPINPASTTTIPITSVPIVPSNPPVTQIRPSATVVFTQIQIPIYTQVVTVISSKESPTPKTVTVNVFVTHVATLVPLPESTSSSQEDSSHISIPAVLGTIGFIFLVLLICSVCICRRIYLQKSPRFKERFNSHELEDFGNSFSPMDESLSNKTPLILIPNSSQTTIVKPRSIASNGSNSSHYEKLPTTDKEKHQVLDNSTCREPEYTIMTDVVQDNDVTFSYILPSDLNKSVAPQTAGL